MMQGWFAVYYRELLIIKRRFKRMVSSMSVSPLLYLVAFGYALGKSLHVGEQSYMEFLIPGLVAMSAMTQAFAVAAEINVARFYWHIFEEIQASPISDAAYVFGEVAAGITRALMSVVIILALSLVFGVKISANGWFWLAVVLNAFVFASLAVLLAMLVKSHADQALLNSFVITPMAFLGGTFFPVESLPVWAQKAVYILPLTHASDAIRTASFGNMPDWRGLALLAGIGSVLCVAAFKTVKQARD